MPFITRSFCLLFFAFKFAYSQNIKPADSVKVNVLKEVTINNIKKPELFNSRKISRKELLKNQSATLGETLSRVPGIQNSYFGPNSGAVVIRSLSGNRVKVLSNGMGMNDLSGISPNLNLITDMDNLLGIDIHINDGNVLFGGRAIGGAVNLKDNTVPKEKAPKTLSGFVRAEGSTNLGYKQSFDLNGNIGKRWVWHAGGMNRWNDDIRIPGNTKAPIAYDPKIDDLTAAMAQVKVEKQTTRNLTLYPYISQFVLQNMNDPAWDLTEADLYTFEDKSFVNGAYVSNPKNSLFIAGQPAGTPLSTTTVKSITDYSPVKKGVMPNSHSRSYAINFGTSYVGEKFNFGAGFRKTYGYYGIPGFALRKLPGHTHTHEDGYSHEVEGESIYLPINTRSESNSILMESEYRPKSMGIAAVRVNYMMQYSKDSELIDDYLANKFSAARHIARLEIDQQPLEFLNGMSGVDVSVAAIDGTGEQRYLPNNKSREYGIFTLQQFAINFLKLNAGYRNDLVQRRAMLTPGYTPSRGLGGGKLSDRDFHLNQFSTSVQADIIKSGYLRASYTHSERAPDVNELYAGNNHFAIILEENGDDRLNKETSKTTEFEAGFNYAGLKLSLTHYHTMLDNYLYLAHTGISRSGGFLVKEWRQSDTKLSGWEAEMGYNKKLCENLNIQLGSYFDLVKNINVSGDHMRDWAEGDYMPNMPASRFGFSAGLSFKKFELSATFDRYLEQRYLGKNINPEPPMPAYSLLAARLAYNMIFKDYKIEYFAGGSNLLNVEARPQNSLLKYLAPLPGINISLGLTVSI
ncbi:iron complex outermembrane receptor protein [Flavobacterium sp. HSC-32F16]|uniref:TonB-dependent receptor domain-containing protein n=1 Tax=Flavobacterium sp. HSC-32F16 TaxID=2910964 RepID=UPI0020A2C20B|nr:TonB-dependent receptor [Flavobacterium sp. HSC-32F16]MCP2029730.1 iron complex outermembrane receptor protein [Flavobacterium sp. HSC-32F16]